MAMRRQMQQMKAEQEASIEHLKKNVKSVRLPQLFSASSPYEINACVALSM